MISKRHRRTYVLGVAGLLLLLLSASGWTVLAEETAFDEREPGFSEAPKLMEPAEELFHIGKDPLEMSNLASNPEASPMLETMRKNYDAELKKWKEQVVSYNNYEKYGVLFDRSIPWEEKDVKKKAAAAPKKELSEEERAERRARRLKAKSAE